MFRKFSILLIGIIIGALSFGAVSVFAQAPIKLIVNGKTINSDVAPQVINGRTMVPARFLAEALGATVTWDESQNAVIVTSQSVNNQKPTDLDDNESSKANVTPPSSIGIDLTSLDYIGTNYGRDLRIDKWRNGNFVIAGKKYGRGIAFNNLGTNKDQYIAYNLNKSYTKLTGYFGTDDSGVGWNKMIVYGDGKEIYESSQVNKGDVPAFVDIDVTGVSQLKIHFTAPKNNGLYPVFADPKLY